MSSGHQAEVFRYQLMRYDSVEPEKWAFDLVLKCALSANWKGRLESYFLQREYQAYKRLDGLIGIPQCFGLYSNEVLVLEYVQGAAYREANFVDREQWFESFDQLIQQMHQRQVSHGDLKRKANILVAKGDKPIILDFGISVVRRPSWLPINRWLYNYQCKTDINAFLKHKYHGDYAIIDEFDRERLNDTLPERIWRVMRKIFGIK